MDDAGHSHLSTKTGPPLAGYRVIELPGAAIAYTGRLLTDLGAEVIKVEPPGGDVLRHREPRLPSGPEQENSLAFQRFHAGKRSLVLDLAKAADLDRLRELIATADVVLEAYPPGYLASRGLGYDHLQGLRPGLVLLSLTPFGQSGPQRDYLGADIVTLATGHLMQVTGDADGPPLRLGEEQSLYLPAWYGAAGVVFALYGRAFNGGQHLDVSMQECLPLFTLETNELFTWQVEGTVARRWGNSRPSALPYGQYPCRDGWVTLVALTPDQWRALQLWIAESGDERILAPEFDFTALRQRIRTGTLPEPVLTFLAARDKLSLTEQAQARSIPLLMVSTPADLVNNEQLRARGFFQTTEHPVLGRIEHPTSGIRFGDERAPLMHAPVLDADTLSLAPGTLARRPA
jgi:crotonobetainyl-CoA:carnitine CoA-transferase CaiB-like acyl-CoA transferase